MDNIEIKKIIFAFGIAFVSLSSFAQNVVTEDNGRVTIRNANDSTIAHIEDIGSGVIAASFNATKTEIALVYSNGDILIKRTDGSLIVQVAEANIDQAISLVWSDDNLIITLQSGQTLTKNALEWR